MLGLALYCAVWLSPLAITPALGRSFMPEQGSGSSYAISTLPAEESQPLVESAELQLEALRDQLEARLLPETLALFYTEKVRLARKDHYLRSSAPDYLSPDTLSDQILRVAENKATGAEVFAYLLHFYRKQSAPCARGW